MAAVHTAPPSIGVSSIGRHISPSLAGVGDRGHVAITFDDGPDPTSTPAVLEALDELGLAGHVLHARRDGPQGARASRPRSRRRVTKSAFTAISTAAAAPRTGTTATTFGAPARSSRRPASSRSGSGRRSASSRSGPCSRLGSRAPDRAVDHVGA